MKDCVFCQTDNIKRDILLESENFFVKVGVGILAPGHVMIIPKMHLTCFGELPQQLMKEFLSLKDEVFNKVKSNFFEPIIFEHGIYGQSISHAHMHIIPIKSGHYNLKNIKENFFKGLKSTKIENFSKLADIFREEGSYLYLKENGQNWVFHTKDAPNGKYIFRKQFANFTGLHGLSDWKAMDDEERERNKEWVKVTKEVFK